MDGIKISVVIPVYNVEAYLAECLDSCLGQKLDGLEFVCVNDGSTDSSPAILNEYAAKDSRIKVINKENGGLSSARNAGIDAASGKWIVLLDSDDKLCANALEELWQLDGKNADIIIFCANTFPKPIEEDQWFMKTLRFEAKEYDSFTPQVLFEERGAMPFVWRHAYRRDKLVESGVRFDESMRFGEDVIFPMSLFPQCSHFVFTDKILYDYRLGRSGSLMTTVHSDPESVVEKHYETIKHVAAYWQEHGWIEMYGAEFLNWALKFTLLKVRDIKGAGRKVRARQMFDEIIAPWGLEKYKSSLGAKGKLMWMGFSAMK